MKQMRSSLKWTTQCPTRLRLTAVKIWAATEMGNPIDSNGRR